MNRPVRLMIALAATTAVGVLTGCTAHPVGDPAPGATARAASVHESGCPDLTEVAALTATPFSSTTASADACSYATAGDVTGPSTVTVQRLAASDPRTAAAVRFSSIGRGAATADLPALGFDAFTAATPASCSAWFVAADGRLTAVTAHRDGVVGTKECTIAGAVAALIGDGSSSVPTVSVLAEQTLLGASSSTASWPWRIGRDAGVRIDRETARGYLSPGSSTSLTAAASSVPADSAAVVLVSGTADLGAPQLEVLRAVTAALSAASGRAPHAKLVVVGPVVTDGAPAAEVADLRLDLESAASIAGAVYVDPGTEVAGATGSGAALTAVARSIDAALRSDAVAKR